MTTTDRFKFRAWDKKLKCIRDCGIDDGGRPMLRSVHYGDMRSLIPEHSLIVMQSTGLKDKNGKLIFEGDIVDWVSTNKGAVGDTHRDVMVWEDYMACFFLMPWVHEPNNAKMVIIGNIHENPELLEVK